MLLPLPKAEFPTTHHTLAIPPYKCCKGPAALDIWKGCLVSVQPSPKSMTPSLTIAPPSFPVLTRTLPPLPLPPSPKPSKSTMLLEMQEWVDPQLAQTYQKLARQASSHKEWMLAWQALPHPQSPDREFLWEYIWPLPELLLVTCEEEEKWEKMCKERTEKEKLLQPPLKCLGPLPSIHNLLGAALHQSNMKKRKGSPVSFPTSGTKRARLSLP
jgi:hypothetical protein